MEESNLDVKLALEEMRISLKQSLDAADAIDQKLNSILIASGLIIALVTTLHISIFPNHTILTSIILSTLIFLYILSIFIAMWGASPKDYKLPISSEWSVLDDSIFGKQEREAILILLSGYVDQIQHNRHLNSIKVKQFKVSLIILLVVVILISILAFIK